MTHPQPAPDFLDARLEWRRIFAEAWGTFLLVLVACGRGMVAARAGETVFPAVLALAPGLVVMSIIYFMGAVSGAHLNPAVTFAFAVRRNFPWQRVPGYLMAQALGGCAAVGFLRLVFGPVGMLGATVPSLGIGDVRAVALEAVLTAGLVNTILGTASGARNIGANGAIAVGGYIAVATLCAEPVTGASMNPIRSAAPDLLRGDMSTTWVYVAGPGLGALIGVGCEWILKGKPTRAGAMAARGAEPVNESVPDRDGDPGSGSAL